MQYFVLDEEAWFQCKRNEGSIHFPSIFLNTKKEGPAWNFERNRQVIGQTRRIFSSKFSKWNGPNSESMPSEEFPWASVYGTHSSKHLLAHSWNLLVESLFPPARLLFCI